MAWPSSVLRPDQCARHQPVFRDRGIAAAGKGSGKGAMSSFPHMLIQETQRAAPGEIGSGLAVARPFVAIKAVGRVRIGIDFRLRLLAPDLLDGRHGNALVLLP